MLHFLQTFLFSRENARPASRDKGHDGDVYCWNNVIVCLYFAFYFWTLIIHQYSPGHAEVDNANGRSCASASRLMNVHKFPKPEKNQKNPKQPGDNGPQIVRELVDKKRIFSEMIYNSIAALAIYLDFSKHSLLIKDTIGFIIASLVPCFLIPMVKEGQLWTLAIDHPSITFNMVWHEISHPVDFLGKKAKSADIKELLLSKNPYAPHISSLHLIQAMSFIFPNNQYKNHWHNGKWFSHEEK